MSPHLILLLGPSGSRMRKQADLLAHSLDCPTRIISVPQELKEMAYFPIEYEYITNGIISKRDYFLSRVFEEMSELRDAGIGRAVIFPGLMTGLTRGQLIETFRSLKEIKGQSACVDLVFLHPQKHESEKRVTGSIKREAVKDSGSSQRGWEAFRLQRDAAEIVGMSIIDIDAGGNPNETNEELRKALLGVGITFAEAPLTTRTPEGTYLY